MFCKYVKYGLFFKVICLWLHCIQGLRDQLEDKLAKRIPVIGVIAIMGTTEESAVDPLTEILEIKHEMRARVKHLNSYHFIALIFLSFPGFFPLQEWSQCNWSAVVCCLTPQSLLC